MADDDLSKDDKKEIMAWLSKNWVTSKNCPICEHNQWIVGGDLVTPVRLRGGGLSIGGRTYPQYMIVCGNCGYTQYFNAAVAKLNKLQKDESEGGDSGDTS